jgi:hypothetical protein
MGSKILVELFLGIPLIITPSGRVETRLKKWFTPLDIKEKNIKLKR